MKFAASFQSVIILIFIFFGKEFIHKIELLAQRPLNQSRTSVEKALKVRCFYDLLGFLLW